MQIASISKRLVAAMVDFIVVVVIVAIASAPVLVLSKARFEGTGVTFLHVVWLWFLPVIFLLVPFAYHSICLTRFSATPGKRMMKLEVTDVAGNRIGWGRSILRYVMSGISAGCLGIGYLVACFDSDRRTVHDRVAGTLVLVAGESRSAKKSEPGN